MQKISAKIFLIIVATMLFISCDSDIRAKFEITNNSEFTIDSLNIKSFDHEQTSENISIKPNERKIYFMDMTNLPKVDGDYLLSFKRGKNGIKEVKRFGYFTNGYQIEKLTKIKIESDTVIFDNIYYNY